MQRGAVVGLILCYTIAQGLDYKGVAQGTEGLKILQNSAT
jgi:hypothetical protein